MRHPFVFGIYSTRESGIRQDKGVGVEPKGPWELLRFRSCLFTGKVHGLPVAQFENRIISVFTVWRLLYKAGAALCEHIRCEMARNGISSGVPMSNFRSEKRGHFTVPRDGRQGQGLEGRHEAPVLTNTAGTGGRGNLDHRASDSRNSSKITMATPTPPFPQE